MTAALQMPLSPSIVPDVYGRQWFNQQIDTARTLGPVLQSRWRWNSVKKIRNYKGVSPELGQMSAANNELRKSVESLRRMDLNLAASDEEIRDWSKAKARQFEKWVHDCGAPKEKALMMLEPYGLELPSVSRPKDPGAYKVQVTKLCCPKWWRRQVRVLSRRHCEALLRDLGETRKHRGAYLSDYSVNRVLQSKQQNLELLEGMEAENDLGQVYRLSELCDLGISNPGIRRGELMTRIRGFESWVEGHKTDNWRGMFYTITCPSKYHAWHSRGGKNKHFDGFSPVDGQKYLCKVWARIRAKWARMGIEAFGFRVAEPHHDGTPHWHLLLFIRAEHTKAATMAMRDHAYAEDIEELGTPKAKKARFTAVKIDPNKGSASGYIAKYIAKNIDGFKIDFDHEAGARAVDTAVRVLAWASLWGVRQFQQIGGPPVTPWREARRLANNPSQLPPEGQLPLVAEQIIDAADRGQWALYTELMGGAVCRRGERPMQVFYLVSQELSGYGETAKKIKGVTVDGFLFPLISRARKWVTRRIQGAKEWVQGLVAASPTPLEYCQ